MLHRSFISRAMQMPHVGDTPRARPVVSRTRSWRGLMQVRYDDSTQDTKYVMKQFFFWSPLRVFGCALFTLTCSYFYLGHDGFMYTMFGYESEATVEARPLHRPSHGIGELLFDDRRMLGGYRKLEEDKEEKPKFNVFFTPEKAEPTTIRI